MTSGTNPFASPIADERSAQNLLRHTSIFLKEFISTSTMTWVICPSEIYKEFTEMSPETDSEILTMSVAQNAYVLNKEFKNLKLAERSAEPWKVIEDIEFRTVTLVGNI